MSDDSLPAAPKGMRFARRGGNSLKLFPDGQCGKKAYATKAKAVKQTRKSREALYVYRCRRCSAWHLSSQKRRPPSQNSD